MALGLQNRQPGEWFAWALQALWPPPGKSGGIQNNRAAAECKSPTSCDPIEAHRIAQQTGRNAYGNFDGMGMTSEEQLMGLSNYGRICAN